ncbi:hypothetical protein Cgig2_010253 [Carnegiea gigantea]|uniref:Uncharacterized protein n=1 Tax=Carnegiea gigantea TaxID=171969 RepID=A0A9Q1GTS2_9CARY|nr:hypothetical protein Cgig2_010253 [Carnegiea gigantea]
MSVVTIDKNNFGNNDYCYEKYILYFKLLKKAYENPTFPLQFPRTLHHVPPLLLSTLIAASRLLSSKEDESKLKSKLRKGFRWAFVQFAAGTIAQGFRWAISDLHDLVQNKDKEAAPQTQEEMLLQVLGPKSRYTRGKGCGYGGSIKARINEEQQQKICEQQK